MGNTKQIAIIAGSVIVIVLAGIFIVKRVSPGIPKMSDKTLAQVIMKVDMKTGEIFELSLGEWQKLGRDKDGYYKNPKTGEYTICYPTRCESCGEWTAGPSVRGMSEEERRNHPPGPPPMDTSYICPKCGKPAFVR